MGWMEERIFKVLLLGWGLLFQGGEGRGWRWKGDWGGCGVVSSCVGYSPLKRRGYLVSMIIDEEHDEEVWSK